MWVWLLFFLLGVGAVPHDLVPDAPVLQEIESASEPPPPEKVRPIAVCDDKAINLNNCMALAVLKQVKAALERETASNDQVNEMSGGKTFTIIPDFAVPKPKLLLKYGEQPKLSTDVLTTLEPIIVGGASGAQFWQTPGGALFVKSMTETDHKGWLAAKTSWTARFTNGNAVNYDTLLMRIIGVFTVQYKSFGGLKTNTQYFFAFLNSAPDYMLKDVGVQWEKPLTCDFKQHISRPNGKEDECFGLFATHPWPPLTHRKKLAKMFLKDVLTVLKPNELIDWSMFVTKFTRKNQKPDNALAPVEPFYFEDDNNVIFVSIIDPFMQRTIGRRLEGIFRAREYYGQNKFDRYNQKSAKFFLTYFCGANREVEFPWENFKDEQKLDEEIDKLLLTDEALKPLSKWPVENFPPYIEEWLKKQNNEGRGEEE